MKNKRPVILFFMLIVSNSLVLGTPNVRTMSAENRSVDEFLSGHDAALYPRMEHSMPSEMYSLTASPNSAHLLKMKLKCKSSQIFLKKTPKNATICIYLNRDRKIFNECVRDSSIGPFLAISMNVSIQNVSAVLEQTCDSVITTACTYD